MGKQGEAPPSPPSPHPRCRTPGAEGRAVGRASRRHLVPTGAWGLLGRMNCWVFPLFLALLTPPTYTLRRERSQKIH